jgi:hypothetical protein
MVAKMATRFGLAWSVAAGLTAEAIALRSKQFHDEYNEQVPPTVEANGAVFVDPGFKFGDGFLDQNTKLFEGTNDPQFFARASACNDAYQQVKVPIYCPFASAGHPNQGGAQLYRDAIVVGLTHWITTHSVPQIVELSMSAKSPNLAQGDATTLDVTARYSTGTTGDAASMVDITSDNPAVARVDSASMAVIAVAPGTATITATTRDEQPYTASIVITVSRPALRRIDITPQAPLLAVGGTQRLTAEGTWSDGTTTGLTGAQWTTSRPGVVAVGPAGKLTGLRTGSAVITATYGSIGTSVTAQVLSGPPQVSGFSPAKGAPGTKITVKGNNLTGVTVVKFGGVSATDFTVDSNTRITVTVPQGAHNGVIKVKSDLGSATSPGRFTVFTR